MYNPIKYIKQKLTVDMPYALAWDEWDDWHKTVKKQRPVAYFASINLPKYANKCLRFIFKPWTKIRHKIKSRILNPTHLIKTGLRPSCYHEIHDRMLHGMFSLLVDHVEIYLSSIQREITDISTKNTKSKWVKDNVSNWIRYNILLTRPVRDPKNGCQYIKVEMNVHPFDDFAYAMQEIWQLYNWWKYIRPARPDPYIISGWKDWEGAHGTKTILKNNLTPEQDKEFRNIMAEYEKMDDSYKNEDQDMLERLIKIRGHLQ